MSRITPRPGSDGTPTWTTVGGLVATLQRRWQKGTYLRAHAAGLAFDSISLPVRAPTTTDLAERPDEVRGWADRFDRDNRAGTGRAVFDLDRKIRRTRTIGDTSVPIRAHIPSLERLCTALGTQAELATLDQVLATTRSWSCGDPTRDAIASWVADNPRTAIEHHEIWHDLLAVVAWIADDHRDRAHLDLRHLDVPGVDTKFVERHRKVLGRLLAQVLPEDQIDRTARTFAGRYGFRERSSYVRFRILDQVPELPSSITEAELRVDELAALRLSVTTVFIIENRASYLDFPRVPNAMAVFGEGFGVTVLDQISWLGDCELVYWGDIDTHGFAILDRLRKRVPAVSSILMDRATLIDHLSHVVVEERPTDAPLAALTDAEAAVHRDLIEDRFGPKVRLEQERIRFAALRGALSPWIGDDEPVRPANMPRIE